MTVRVLITGFGAFPGAPFNPSAALARALARVRRPALADVEFATHIFATSYAAIDRDLPKLLAGKPDVVLMFGLAARRRELCIETRARNAASVLFPDASGREPSRGTIVKGGPAALRGRASFPSLLRAARARGGSARLSRDAGRYVCNYAFWRGLELAGGGPLVQFVHIPAARRGPKRKGQRKVRALSALVRDAEAVLIALVAASRR